MNDKRDYKAAYISLATLCDQMRRNAGRVLCAQSPKARMAAERELWFDLNSVSAWLPPSELDRLGIHHD